MNNIKSNTNPNKRDYWGTPQWFVDQVEDLLKVKFVLDAAATEDNSKGWCYLDEQKDSLSKDWAKVINDFCHGDFVFHPAIFVNPPFSQLDLWINKIIEESQKGLTICLVHPDLSDPGWSQKIEDNCFMQLVPRKRLNYINPETGYPSGGIPFNSCVSVFNGMPRNIVQRIRFDLNKPEIKSPGVAAA